MRIMIIIQNLKKSFGSRPIIRDFTYQFPKNKRISVVGANGAGKTTLLNMICGSEEIDSGSITVPSGCVLGYLPQIPNPSPNDTILLECLSGNEFLSNLQLKLNDALKEIENNYSEEVFENYEKVEQEFSLNGGYEFESDAKGILVGLGIENEQFHDNPKTLSGGWRMRLELAKLLLNHPNFLILDEPTNHLDLPSLTWLENYLKSFAGTLLFVSHDRDFLNNISEMTIHISNGNVDVYSGDFDSFVMQKQGKTEQLKKEKESLKKKQDHLQDFVDRFRAKATKAKQAQSKIKLIEKLKTLEGRIDIDEDDQSATFNIKSDKQPGKIVVDLKDCAIGYDDLILSKNLNLRVARGNKIAIIGANGIGKSTLLKSILGEIKFLQGECKIGHNVDIGYYAQEQTDILDGNLDAIENVMMLAGKINAQQARSVLGALLIKKDDAKKLVKVLSGGEKSKVAIAALIARKTNFLILDEPTNHLDMSSVEALSRALDKFDGTVLTVSHNRSFINSFATHMFVMEKRKGSQLIARE